MACCALPVWAQQAPAEADEAAVAKLPPVELRSRTERRAAGQLSLSREELRTLPGSAGDPLRASFSLPGVTTVDDASAAPAVRGARPEDNAYLVDGLPVGYLFHAGGLVSVFHPELIRRFDLNSAAWGADYPDVVGAVFDIGLRDPRRDRLGVVLDVSLFGANALVEGPITDRLSFWAAGRRSWFDLVSKAVEGKDAHEGTTVTVPRYHDAQARLLWQLTGSQRLRLDASGAGDALAFKFSDKAREAQRDPVLIGDSQLQRSSRSVALSWDGEFESNVSQTLSLGQLTETGRTQIGQAGQVDDRTVTRYLRERLRWQPSEAVAVTLGGSLERRRTELNIDALDPRCTEFDPNCDFTSAPHVQGHYPTTRDLSAAFASLRWRLAPAWTWTNGLRVSHDSLLGGRRVEPRTALEWAWSPATTLSAAWGRHNQPAADEETLPGVGNPLLQHLHSQHLTLGVNQSLGEGWSWRGEVYAKRFDGYALFDPQLNYRNGGSGRSQGLELLVRKEATSRLSGFVSVSYSKATRHNELTGQTFRFAYDQPLIVNLVGQYKLTPKWQLGARWSYHSGSPTTPIIGTRLNDAGRVRPVYGEINAERLPVYHRLDLRADYRVSERFTTYVELLNAYGRRNVAGYSYSADYKSREPVEQLGLLPSFGLEYRY